VTAGGWDIRARWFGVVVCVTPQLGELGRGITIPWRVLAALITAQQGVPVVLGKFWSDISDAMKERASAPGGCWKLQRIRPTRQGGPR